MANWRQIQHEYQLEQDGDHIPYDQDRWTAQICLNGHVLNGGTSVVSVEKFCEKCGAGIIHQCPSCHNNIKGALRWVSGDRIKKPPMCCPKCGKLYPWTQEYLKTAHQLLEHDKKLSQEDRKELYSELQYVMSDPNAQFARAKKKLISIRLETAEKSVREFILDLIAKMAVEYTKP